LGRLSGSKKGRQANRHHEGNKNYLRVNRDNIRTIKLREKYKFFSRKKRKRTGDKQFKRTQKSDCKGKKKRKDWAKGPS